MRLDRLLLIALVFMLPQLGFGSLYYPEWITPSELNGKWECQNSHHAENTVEITVDTQERNITVISLYKGEKVYVISGRYDTYWQNFASVETFSLFLDDAYFYINRDREAAYSMDHPCVRSE